MFKYIFQLHFKMGVRGKGRREKSDFFNSRIRADINKAFKTLLEETQIDKRTGLELALCDFILKFEGSLTFEGIDFKKIVNYYKMETLRNFQVIERKEFLSGHLIIPRIRNDIYKLIIYHKKNKDRVKKLVSELIEIRKKECQFYANKEEILNYIKEYEDLINKGEIERIINKIELETNNINLLEVKK